MIAALEWPGSSRFSFKISEPHRKRDLEVSAGLIFYVFTYIARVVTS